MENEITVIFVSFHSAHIIEESIKTIDKRIKIIVVENSKDLTLKSHLEKKYANIELIQNIIFYLLEDSNLIDSKMKDLNYYRLDKNKVDRYKLSFQYLNLLLPIIFCLIIFTLRYFYRKNKYNFKN